MEDQGSNIDELRKSLSDEAEAMRCEWNGSSSIPTNEQLHRFALIHTVVNLLNPESKRRHFERWLVAALVFISFTVCYTLVLKPVENTEVSINGFFTSVLWQSSDRQVLDGLILTDIKLRGFKKFQLERDANGHIIRKEALNEVSIQGSGIRMYTVFGTSETIYEIATTSESNRFILRLAKPEPHHIHKDESLIFFETPGKSVFADGVLYKGGDGSRVILTVSPIEPELLEIEFSVNPTTGLQLTRQISTNNLLFYPLERIDKDKGIYWIQQPTSLNGNVRILSINEKQHTLFEGDCLYLDDLKGDISSIRLKSEGVSLSVSGQVSDIRLGSCRKLKSLKPSVLEEWRENNTVSMIWGGAGSIIAVLFALIRWWKPNNT